MPSRFHAPYMEWAKTRPAARFDLAGSNILACTLEDIEGAREALSLSGHNDNGYAPLMDAIAARYGVERRARDDRHRRRRAPTSRPAPRCSILETTC